MKRKVMVLMAVVFMLFSVNAWAATFSVESCLTVSADKDGKVTISGSAADVDRIKKLIEFCPDKFKGGCWDNLPLNPVSKDQASVLFELDKDRVKSNQRSFNFKSNGLWLLIPHPMVKVGSNLILENSMASPDSEDGRGGAHFTFIGDVTNYQPLYPLTNWGGEACGEKVVSQPVAAPAPVAPAPKMVEKAAPASKGDAMASSGGIKGNDNKVTQQPVKQVQKNKIKGNNNKVSQTQISNQSSVNVKTGNNSPVNITVHQGGYPGLFDSSCLKCHKQDDVRIKDGKATIEMKRSHSSSTSTETDTSSKKEVKKEEEKKK